MITEKEVRSIPETEETLVKTRMTRRVKDQSRMRRKSPTPIPRTRGPSSISPAAISKTIGEKAEVCEFGEKAGTVSKFKFAAASIFRRIVCSRIAR